MIYLDRWNLGCCRKQIIHKTGVNKLPFFVINEPFKKSSADTLGHTTMHLPLDNSGINHTPTVMHSRVFDERDHARFRVNLDDGPVDATGKTSVRGTIKLARLQTRCASLRRQGWSRTRSSK